MDPARHRTETGADNRLILDNLSALSDSDIDVWIRIPLIPGFNDDWANIEDTGAFLDELSRRHRIYVLPYHEFADGKRARMEKPGDRIGVGSPDTEMLNAVAERLARHDLEVIVGGTA
jgi:pyruvate formate lyase activating enzyme